MATIKQYTSAGAAAADLSVEDGQLVLDKGAQALKDAVTAIRNAMRAGTACTKGKGEVAGSNKKPWKQKGTGRARAGSTRSPLWVGGGTVFGPHPRKYAFSMPRKQRRLALKCALSDKVKSGDLIVLESLNFDAPKTKQVVKMLGDFGVDSKALFITADEAENVEKSARNIPGAKAIQALGLNVYDILHHDKLFITKDAITRIEEVFA